MVCNWNNAKSFNWKDYDIVAFNEIWGIKEFVNLSVDGFEVKAKKNQKNKTTVKRGWYYNFWEKRIGNKRIKHSLFGRNN